MIVDYKRNDSVARFLLFLIILALVGEMVRCPLDFWYLVQPIVRSIPLGFCFLMIYYSIQIIKNNNLIALNMSYLTKKFINFIYVKKIVFFSSI